MNGFDFFTEQHLIINVFISPRQSVEQVTCDNFDALAAEEGGRDLTDEQRDALALYQGSFDDDRVDHGLVIKIIELIQRELAPEEAASPSEAVEGAILVFLPGYDDIVTLR